MRASSESLRNQNRALVLSTLRRLGRASHTEIADWSGLASATVSAITSELEAENVLARREIRQAEGRGRPRILFGQNPESAYIAAARITADAIEFSMLDYAGVLKDRFSVKRDIAGRDMRVFERNFRGGLDRLVERARLKREQIRTVSVTSKGLVAPGAPVLVWSPVLDDIRVDFESMLRSEWTAHVTLTNETRFAAQALAARRRGAEPMAPSIRIACLSLDHSIGLGIATVDPTGAVTSFAPPFGHMVHQPDGPVCRCGRLGCIEAYAGFYGILRCAFSVPENTIPAKFVPLEQMEQVAAGARAGDRMGQYAFRIAGEALGMGISRLHSFLGLMPVVITGPGLRFFPLMEEGFMKHVNTSLQARFEAAPEISFEPDEQALIFEGNVEASLAELDSLVIAERKTEGAKQ